MMAGLLLVSMLSVAPRSVIVPVETTVAPASTESACAVVTGAAGGHVGGQGQWAAAAIDGHTRGDSDCAVAWSVTAPPCVTMLPLSVSEVFAPIESSVSARVDK